MSLNEYLDQLRQALDQIDSYGFAESIEINQEVRSGKQATILIKVVLVDSSTLIIREYIDAQYKVEKLSYAYHYQAGDGNLIFRYDNAKHKPDLGYEEHKHTANGKTMHCESPDISELVNEVIKFL